MVRYRAIILLCVWVCAVVPPVRAQEVITPTLIPENTAYSQKYSGYYEGLIRDVLLKYYSEKSFLIDVKAYVSDLKPLLPKGNWADVPGLPGLPVLPDEFQLDGNGENTPVPPDGQLLDVEVLVDTSYEERDLIFIKSLVTMAANLNDMRGDRLLVRRGIFPKGKTPAGSGSLLQRAASPDEPSAPEPFNPYKSYIDNLGSLIPLIITFLFLALLVWIISRSFSAPKLSKKMETESYKSILDEIKNLQNLSQPKPAAEGAKKNTELENVTTFLTNAFIGDPQACAEVIQQWIEEDRATALKRCGRIFFLTDMKLLELLRTDLPEDFRTEVESELKSFPETPEEELIKAGVDFKTAFQKSGNLKGKEKQYRDLFGFLRQMSDHQIIHLIKDESEGIIGLTLAQMDSQKAATVLQRIDKEKRTKVLAGMGKVGKIPVKSYKQLADRLAGKAVDIVNMRYVASDGVESLLDVLDNLPLDAQSEYLNSIAEINLDLAEKIKDRFITLPEVSGLPDKFLQSVSNNLDQDTLVLTLASAEEGLRNKILPLLPERMKAMIESGMESASETPLEQIEAAQKKFLQVIRRELKLSGGRPT